MYDRILSIGIIIGTIDNVKNYLLFFFFNREIIPFSIEHYSIVVILLKS